MLRFPLFLGAFLFGYLIANVVYAQEPAGDQSGEKRDDTLTVMLPGDVELLLKKIPAGVFMMGSPGDELGCDDDEGPVHEVTITKPYYIGVYEVTQSQWTAVMKSNPSKYQGKPDNPVETVSWRDCQRFVKKLNDLGLGRFRLPTEAEWEYACRAGTTTRFYWGNDRDYSQINDHAWWNNNAPSATSKVGTKKPNAWGLYDMSGNVYEWCSDRYGAFSREPQTDPTGPESGEGRPVRGGAWFSTTGCRSAERTDGFPPDSKCYGVGLRLVRICP